MAIDSPERPTVTTSLNVATQMLGGLGNQLFQYAAGRALAERLGARLILDSTRRWERSPAFVLDRYPIDAEMVSDVAKTPRRRYFRIPGAVGGRLTDAFHQWFPRGYRIDERQFNVFGERDPFTYEPYFEQLSGSTYLIGYWQSYRYFESAAAVIRSELRPAWPLTPANRSWLSRIEAANAVCMHVRRGDYLHDRGPPQTCAPSYYDAALQHVRGLLQAPAIFVFSDDIAWCRTAFGAQDVSFVDSNGPEAAADDLRLMAACRHHIIANSSLSWWAAWLAQHPEQLVIAPEPWLPWVPVHADLLPAHWVKLPRA